MNGPLSGLSLMRGSRGRDEARAPTADESTFRSDASFRNALILTSGLCLLGVGFGIGLDVVAGSDVFRSFAAGVNVYLFLKEDVFWLAAVAMLVPLAWLLAPRVRPATTLQLSRRYVVPATVLLFFATAAAGVILVYHGYALSLDEFLARFQARALHAGHLFAPVPAQWRPFEHALQPIFMRYDVGGVAWGPGYRHGNALILAAFDLVHLMPWAHVFSGAAALLLLAALTRKLWPDVAWAPAASVLLLASAPQFWVTSMTSYAMTPHLLVTLAWVVLYLRDDVPGHIGALLLAPIAIGIHHVYVHPLVAFPFLLWLAADRRWRLAAVYAAWYALWIALWIAWRDLLFPATSGGQAESSFMLARFLGALLQGHSVLDLVFWPTNLFRFIAWQNLALLPLAVVGLSTLRSAPRAVRAGTAAVILLLLPMILVMPGQGHGWGYRYLHPALGFIVLIAVHGAVSLVRTADAADAPRVRRAVVALALLSIVALPLRAVQVERFVRPFAAASDFIATRPADVVLVDNDAIWFGADLSRNDPMLRRRPLVMIGGLLPAAQLRTLCTRYRVQFVDLGDLSAFGMRSTTDPPKASLRDRARTVGCSMASR